MRRDASGASGHVTAKPSICGWGGFFRIQSYTDTWNPAFESLSYGINTGSPATVVRGGRLENMTQVSDATPSPLLPRTGRQRSAK